MKHFKKSLFLILAAALLAASCTVLAGASYEGEKRVALGADLSEDEISEVYEAFGIDRGSVTELTVSQADEREYLEGVISEEQLQGISISSVYITLTGEGDGLDVSVSNISWVTREIYMNALTTAGIYDADVIITAPYSVTGTAALTGIYKAYEDITGSQLSEKAKQAAAEELVTTSELADVIGSADATEIVNQLKLILDETVNMTDEELRDTILEIADKAGVSLNDDQISQLISLVRSLEKLDVSQLTEKVKDVQKAIENLAETGSKVSGFLQKVGEFFRSIGDWFSGLFS